MKIQWSRKESDPYEKELLTLCFCLIGLWGAGTVQATAPVTPTQPSALRYFGNAHETLALVPQKSGFPSAMRSPAKMGRAGTGFICLLNVRTATPFGKKALRSKLTVRSVCPLVDPSLLQAVMSTLP